MIARISLLLLLVTACASERDKSQWPVARSELEQGTQAVTPAERTYRRYCIGCHGADGRGNGGVTGADFTAPGSPLATKSDAELIASVRDGRRGVRATMPAHRPVLSDAEIQAVVAHVKTRFAPH